MKKVLTLVLMATLTTSVLAGCSSSKSDSTGKKVTVGTTIYKFDDTFMTGVRNAITDQAKSDNITADIVDSQNSTSAQNDKLELFISKKVNSLAINPVDPKASSTIINKAKSANIPIVFFNRIPSEADMNSWDKLFYVGAKPEQSGTIQGQIIADYWKAHPEADKNKDGVLDYVMITGEPGNADAIARTKYSIDQLATEGIKSNQLATDTGMWDRVKAQDKMQSFLTSKGDLIEAVFANNDDMALGAIEALKAAGYFKDGKYIPVVGVDATAPGVKAIEEGTMLGTVLNDAKNQGIATIKIAEVLGQGETPSKENTGYDIADGKYVWIDYKKITKENVNDAK
ncbi:galactose/glucose ABC transporter substrate-binding protein MglB [Clostridium sp. SHJSY1]|uniref:galactose ABC transporter substrate-binding protein n=1 Tax=Clostridium sp. SHJSY1 TaxID=2942483 RepID=UPI002873F5F4|nr:galactose ABC transporter substrate-binding protein [Clostridium sp. SHJSY1]MDS0524237.1 galactose/glucose ABC transporter substrate-binding protein MglB [Clostridium sp. SHJSY1]